MEPKPLDEPSELPKEEEKPPKRDEGEVVCCWPKIDVGWEKEKLLPKPPKLLEPPKEEEVLEKDVVDAAPPGVERSGMGLAFAVNVTGASYLFALVRACLRESLRKVLNSLYAWVHWGVSGQSGSRATID